MSAAGAALAWSLLVLSQSFAAVVYEA